MVCVLGTSQGAMVCVLGTSQGVMVCVLGTSRLRIIEADANVQCLILYKTEIVEIDTKKYENDPNPVTVVASLMLYRPCVM